MHLVVRQQALRRRAVHSQSKVVACLGCTAHRCRDIQARLHVQTRRPLDDTTAGLGTGVADSVVHNQSIQQLDTRAGGTHRDGDVHRGALRKHAAWQRHVDEGAVQPHRLQGARGKRRVNAQQHVAGVRFNEHAADGRGAAVGEHQRRLPHFTSQERVGAGRSGAQPVHPRAQPRLGRNDVPLQPAVRRPGTQRPVLPRVVQRRPPQRQPVLRVYGCGNRPPDATHDQLANL